MSLVLRETGDSRCPGPVTRSHPAVKVCFGTKAGRGLRSCQFPDLHGEQDVLGEPLWARTLESHCLHPQLSTDLGHPLPSLSLRHPTCKMGIGDHGLVVRIFVSLRVPRLLLQCSLRKARFKNGWRKEKRIRVSSLCGSKERGRGEGKTEGKCAQPSVTGLW